MDKQKEALRELWRAAGAAADGVVEIPCDSKEDAVKFRFALYNAVKGLREGPNGEPPKEVVDAPLLDAVVNCSVGFSSEDPTIVVLRQKTVSKMMQRVMGVLKTQGREIVSSEDRALLEAERRLIEGVERDAQAAPSNPYYTRTGKGMVK